MKTPEEYFQEQNFDSLEKGSLQGFTAEEKLFLEKYLGQDALQVINELRGDEICPESLDSSAVSQVALHGQDGRFDLTGVASDIEQRLKESEVVQFVSFYIEQQEYALPIEIVSEVIRYVAPTKLPASPDYLAGVINLRGRITPVVKLDRLLNVVVVNEENKFIVVCKYRGLQFGLLINRIATMYRIEQQNIAWEIESGLGVNVEFIAGLIKGKEKIISILSAERIIGILIDH